MKFILLGILLSVSSTFASDQVNLDQCFQAAFKRSEIIGNQIQLINQVEETYKRAIGSVLPNLSASASYGIQQEVSGTAGSFYPATQPLVKITASQPLFQGLREFAGLRQTQAAIQVQNHSKTLASIQLYQDVATNFYAIASLQKDLKNIQQELGLYEKRIEELNEFVKIGRSRESEVLTVQTQLETLKAQYEQQKTLLQANLEVFYFLTGLSKEAQVLDQDVVPNSLSPVASYLSEIEKRPDVLQAKASVQVSEEGIRIAQGAHYPSLNFLGNYYFLRYGALQNVNWDVQFALSLPIFSGGVIQSAVRTAESQKTQGELNLSRVQRSAEQEISSLHNSVLGDQVQEQYFGRITQIAEKNYKIQVQDYKRGLVNNIDVLQSLTSFQESQRALDRSKFAVKLDFAKLEASVAHRPKVLE